MARVAAGDLQALGLLFERYKQPLFRFLYRLLQRVEFAEDLLQEAFLRLYDRRARFKPGSRFAPWLYAIAHHLAIDALRRERRLIPLDDVPEGATASTLCDDLVRAEVAGAVRVAIAALPVDQRVALVLREYEGFSYREIADIVGCREEAARVRCHRARLALKAWLGPVLETQFREAGGPSPASS
jgi:RNA polymerase sigma-70 factor (ECF subfamily)